MCQPHYYTLFLIFNLDSNPVEIGAFIIITVLWLRKLPGVTCPGDTAKKSSAYT